MLLFIPGFVIGWVTFPGVIIHEFAHKKACEWRDVTVNDVTYFALDGGGEVRHQSPRDFRDTLAISTAPLVVNTLLAFLLFAGASVMYLGAPTSLADSSMTVWLLGWLGLSIGWHAIPSFGDSRNIWDQVRARWRESPTVLLAIPLVALLYLGNLLSFLWFDAIYSVAIGFTAFLAVTTLLPA